MASLKFTLPLAFLVLYLFTDHSVSLAVPSNFVGAAPNSYPSPYLLPPSRGVKAAYWASFVGFPALSIDTSYFTHIYYAFVLPDPTTYKLDINPFHQEKIPELINALDGKNPRVEIILSIGRAGNNPKVFSEMASNKSTRAIFINSTIEVACQYGFDGVDLDWEFPKNDLDMTNLGSLFEEWREALDFEANGTNSPRFLLTSAVYYASKINFDGPRSYPGVAMGIYVDWISPMCFDLHGKWNSVTGQHTALYDPNSDISTNSGLESWINAGVPPSKIVMGLALYGHTWTLQDPNVNGVGAPAVGTGPGDINGVLVYSEIVDFNAQNNAVVKFDEPTVSFYSYSGRSWIGYDDVGSIKSKVQYAWAQSLAGYFFWALGQDKNWTLSSTASYAWDN